MQEEDLEQTQSINFVEVEQLKMEKESLLQQNRDLQAQIDSINSNLARVSAELKEQEPVIRCCAAMRNRFFERAKQQLIGGRYVNLLLTRELINSLLLSSASVSCSRLSNATVFTIG
jgi:hypothetical protein